MSLSNHLVSSPSAPVSPVYPALVALLLRLALGLVLLSHGLLKLLVFGLDGTSGFFASLGFAGWLAWPTVAFEVIGGVFLVLGIFVRPVAWLAALLLAVTVYVHAPNGWLFSSAKGGWEYPLFLVVAAVAVGLGGAGRFALRWPGRSPKVQGGAPVST